MDNLINSYLFGSTGNRGSGRPSSAGDGDSDPVNTLYGNDRVRFGLVAGWLAGDLFSRWLPWS